ncbi:MAG: TetR family transcriptional regulator C-terminal domain-containing protein [Oleiphilaceae bacterium]|nr:TetR family transcriptional regulator C-terminal domain-containing protein [Oleiphilaceae bacterium]
MSKIYKTGRIREVNSQRILEAAEMEFVKHGYKGTSMQAVADQAKLPKANVLYYFKSKSALYTAVLHDIIERWNSAVARMSEDDDPKETLERYIRDKVDLAIAQPNASKIFAMEIIQGAPHLQAHLCGDVRHWFKEKVRIIECWIAQGKMKAVNAEHLIFMIWSTTQHYADFETQILTVTSKRGYDSAEVERIKEFLCTMILGGCGLLEAS